jgi:hypothetical protein
MSATLARLRRSRATIIITPGLRRVVRPSRRRVDPDRFVGLACIASAAAVLLLA